MVGITILGSTLLVGNDPSQVPGEFAGQLPSGWSELGLGKEQRTKIQAIQGECKMKIAEVERQLKELQAEEREDGGSFDQRPEGYAQREGRER